MVEVAKLVEEIAQASGGVRFRVTGSNTGAGGNSQARKLDEEELCKACVYQRYFDSDRRRGHEINDEICDSNANF